MHCHWHIAILVISSQFVTLIANNHHFQLINYM
jgi:hypothetical protein